MAYINAQQVKEKRQKIKKEFPSKDGWKFSITNQNHSTIKLAILQAPYDMLKDEYKERGYISVNYYHIADNYNGRLKDDLQKMYTILNEGNFDKSDLMVDYHHVGFYVDITIGSWDKGFKVA